MLLYNRFPNLCPGALAGRLCSGRTNSTESDKVGMKRKMSKSTAVSTTERPSEQLSDRLTSQPTLERDRERKNESSLLAPVQRRRQLLPLPSAAIHDDAARGQLTCFDNEFKWQEKRASEGVGSFQTDNDSRSISLHRIGVNNANNAPPKIILG